MTTTMEHAFAKLLGVSIPPTASGEDNHVNPSAIAIVIGNTRFTMQQLMDGVSLPIRDVDPTILDSARPSVALRRRQYVEKEGALYFQNPGRKSKLIERIGYESPNDQLIRDIDRELVSVLKGEKDLFTTEAGTIKHMRNLLLRLLADARTKALLFHERVQAFKHIGRINAVLEQKREDQSLESASKKYYEKLTTALGFTELDHMVVRALSWEWKNRPIYKNHPYACRCWIIIPCLFGLIKDQYSDTVPKSEQNSRRASSYPDQDNRRK